MENGGIGYQQLNDSEQAAYRILSPALEQGAATVDCSAAEPAVDLLRVFRTVLGDHPELICFDRTKVRWVTYPSGGRRLHLSGCQTTGRARRMTGELTAALADAVSCIRRRIPSDQRDILIGAAEFLQRHVTYDEREAARFAGAKSKNPDSHSAYGALVNGRAVCDGIAAALALIARSFHIPAMMVPGEALSRRGVWGDHTWNIVEIGRRFYHLDATWDINLYAQEREFSYEYFCVSDDDLLGDHRWDIRAAPLCDDSRGNYYVAASCFANNMAQAEDIFRRDIRRGVRVIRLKISRNIAVPEPADRRLAELLLHVAAARGKVEIRYRWNANTRCFFSRFI